MLAENAVRCECAVHAYVLMANHVHLLLTPSGARGASKLAQSLCDGYQRYVAAAYGSENRLWEEDREIRPVYARRYVLACMRYIELNPVRARLVLRPGDYRWSSFRSNALGQADAILTPHPLYYALGRSPASRRDAYARFVLRGWRPGAQLGVNDPEAPEAI
jgi:putative transposase